MMYPFMTLNDDTEITHSEMKPDGKVKVYIETPDENTVLSTLPVGFQTIPGKIFSTTQMKKWTDLMRSSIPWHT